MAKVNFWKIGFFASLCLFLGFFGIFTFYSINSKKGIPFELLNFMAGSCRIDDNCQLGHFCDVGTFCLGDTLLMHKCEEINFNQCIKSCESSKDCSRGEHCYIFTSVQHGDTILRRGGCKKLFH